MRKFVLLLAMAIAVAAQGCNESKPATQVHTPPAQQKTSGTAAMSFEKMKAAAENGDARAQSALGYAYDVGHGVEQNLESAAHWYQQAGEQGHANAQFNFAEMLRDGAGVPQSAENALAWYTKAAMQGHSKAQYNVAMMHVKGEGVAADNVTAYAWLVLAATGDAEGADQALEIVGKGIGDRKNDGDALAEKIKTEMKIAE
ncbi:Localization factor PodJL [Planctomycetes bacterium CA13]|uniref:Localization factor PodJL n=1 Tax=Novipirellula herctigrandis TaxID=2527986 RepID=A0A5C5YUJ8_9BACT|nr:Localization factor PodJL [Planctomycetes bacterium CA13]